MTGTVRIGLWGCGNMGRSLAQALTATGQACLAVAYDVEPEATADISRLYGADAAGSAEELLAYPGLRGF